MADNSTTIRERLAAAVRPLTNSATGDETPDPDSKSDDRSGAVSVVMGSAGRADNARRTEPPDDTAAYWKAYTTTAIVRANINQFADDVVGGTADGRRFAITARDIETERYLREWASGCYITAGEDGHSLGDLLDDLPSRDGAAALPSSSMYRPVRTATGWLGLVAGY